MVDGQTGQTLGLGLTAVLTGYALVRSWRERRTKQANDALWARIKDDQAERFARFKAACEAATRRPSQPVTIVSVTDVADGRRSLPAHPSATGATRRIGSAG